MISAAAVNLYAVDWHVGLQGNVGKLAVGLDTHKAYAGLSFETSRQVFASIDLGVAYNLSSEDLGSKFLFRAALSVGVKLGDHRISVAVDHISNGNLADYNPGRDAIGLVYGYVF